MLTALPKRVGIMGGMFDPVHNGHLQLAEQVYQQCQLDEVILLPCGNPVHRNVSLVSSVHRIRMLELVAADHPWLKVDGRECNNPEPSYSYNTVAQISKECPQAILFLLLGVDAFLALDTWYRWQDISTLAHLVVASRPGYVLNADTLEVGFKTVIKEQLTSSVADTIDVKAGRILLLNLATQAVSSTQARSAIAQGKNPGEMLNPAVFSYIKANKLYQ